MIVNYPSYWIIWGAQTNDMLDIVLRLIAIFLCVGLLIREKWPIFLQAYFNIYWYLTLIFCLPFFFTFMTLKYHGSGVWLMNCMSALFFNMMTTHLLGFFITTTLGVALGVACFHLFMPPFHLDLGTIDLYSIFWTFFAALVIGALFSYSRSQVQDEKLQSLNLLGGMIAHEMRTPFGTIIAISHNIKVILEKYKVTPKKLSPQDMGYFEEFAHNLKITVKNSNSTIDSLLINLKGNIKTLPQKPLRMSTCIKNAVEHYPFLEDEREKVSLMVTEDFQVVGNPNLIEHVFFNLIKNSLYFIKEARKGVISIQVETKPNYNLVTFRDTGKGVSPQSLKKLFDPFYTERPQGTGIGLSFCKRVMESVGGNITCASIEGEFIEFYLYFPKINAVRLE